MEGFIVLRNSNWFLCCGMTGWEITTFFLNDVRLLYFKREEKNIHRWNGVINCILEYECINRLKTYRNKIRGL